MSEVDPIDLPACGVCGTVPGAGQSTCAQCGAELVAVIEPSSPATPAPPVAPATPPTSATATFTSGPIQASAPAPLLPPTRTSSFAPPSAEPVVPPALLQPPELPGTSAPPAQPAPPLLTSPGASGDDLEMTMQRPPTISSAPAELAVPARASTRRRSVLIGAGIGAAVLVVAAITATVLVRSGDTAADLQIELVAADGAGPDPFTDSVSRADVTVTRRFAGERRAELAPGTEGKATIVAHDGSEAGLHGTTADAPICDADALAAALAGDDAKRSEWALAAGIAPADVDEHLAALTPALLSADTLVTNHGWTNGAATEFPSVLEGGTAILVDNHGTPRVRCACGNPLTPAEIADNTSIRLSGDAWQGFDPTSLALVEPAPEPQSSLEFTDISSGEPTVVPVGGIGLTGLLVANDQGVRVVADDGTSTTIASTPARRAYADGSGGVIFEAARAGPLPKTKAEATVWHLRADAAEPTELVTSSDPAQARPLVHGVIEVDGRHLFMYELLTPTSDGSGMDEGGLIAHDLATGQEVAVTDAGAYSSGGMWSITSSGARVAWLRSADGGMYQALEARDATLSDDLDIGWHPFGTAMLEAPNRPCDTTTPPSCPVEIAFVDDAEMVAIARGGEGSNATTLIEVDLRANGAIHPVATLDDFPTAMLSVRLDEIVVSYDPADGPAATAVIVNRSDGTVQNTSLTGHVTYLDQPVRRPARTGSSATPAPPAPAAPPTTAAATPQPAVDPAAIRTTDFRNGSYTLPDTGGYCAGGTYPMVDGEWVDVAGTSGRLVQDPAFGDLDGDGFEEAAVLLTCNGGGSGFSQIVIVFSGADPVQQRGLTGVGGWGADQAAGISIAAGVVLVDMQVNEEGNCCAEGPHYQRRFTFTGASLDEQ